MGVARTELSGVCVLEGGAGGKPVHGGPLGLVPVYISDALMGSRERSQKWPYRIESGTMGYNAQISTNKEGPQ